MMTTKKRKTRSRDLNTASRSALEDFEAACRAHTAAFDHGQGNADYAAARWKKARMRLIERLQLLEHQLAEQKALVKKLQGPAAPSKGLARHLSSGDGAGF